MTWLKPILFAFVFFNPIVLLILFESYWIAILLPLLIVVGSYYLSKLSCLRLTVWAFNIFAIIGLGLNAELVFRSLYQDKNVPNIYEVRGNYYFNKPLLNQKFEGVPVPSTGGPCLTTGGGLIRFNLPTVWHFS